jgi:uncharacterized repeat protein (TIGR03803 family)
MRKQLLTLALLFSFFIGNAQLTKLYDFQSTTGSEPYGSLTFDGTYLYGMTYSGGTNDAGVVFKIKPDGSDYVKLLDFDFATNGGRPYGALFPDSANLYGLTYQGGPNGKGALFKLKQDGSECTNLYGFGGTYGGYSHGSLISDGTFLYGMETNGGTYDDGIIFRIKPDGSEHSTLFSFRGYYYGANPRGDLVFDGTYLYGMTCLGGKHDSGTIFRIKQNGTGFLKLHEFANDTNGCLPFGSLIIQGNELYGLTSAGGTNHAGVAFKIQRDGTGYVKLYDFDGTNGTRPYGSLISDGTYLYGMTPTGGNFSAGVIFRMCMDGSGYTRLFNFEGSHGSEPYGSLISDGVYLYGMTYTGGANGKGVIFKIVKPVGINEVKPVNPLLIYPNPSKDFLTIQSVQDSEIEIVDIQGRTILRTRIAQGQSEVDVRELSKGMYFVRFYNNKQSGGTRFVKE